jgi:hypothetical protein
LSRVEAGDELIDAFRAWAESAIARDARRRRNLAIHAHYENRPHRTELTWLLDPVEVDGKPSPYDGPVDVHSYAAAFAESLTALERITDWLSNET